MRPNAPVRGAALGLPMPNTGACEVVGTVGACHGTRERGQERMAVAGDEGFSRGEVDIGEREREREWGGGGGEGSGLDCGVRAWAPLSAAEVAVCRTPLLLPQK